MKYNSIGEQLIAKAQELDPNYKPDKFNDMSEAIDVILKTTGSGGGAIDLSKYINIETVSFISKKLRSELIEEVKKGISVGYITFPGENIMMFFNIYLFNDYISMEQTDNTCSYSGNDSYTITGVYKTSLFNYYIRDNLQLLMSDRYFYTFPSGASPYHVIPSVDTEGKQQNLTIGDGLEIKDGALTTKSSGGGSLYFNIEPYISSYEETDEGLISGKITQEGLNLLISQLNKGQCIGVNVNGTIPYAYEEDYDSNGDTKTRYYFKRNFANMVNIVYAIDKDLNIVGSIETLLNIPALPSDASTKTYVLKAVNGVLTWSE